MASSSQTLFQRAASVIPGGVNSPVRAFRAVGGEPLFIDRAEGPYIFDTSGRRYIDYVGSWGPMILGHANPEVLEAVRSTLDKGTSFGAPTELEVEMAELVTSIVPNVDLVRMVNSGTEATMSAIRLARAYTEREYILKFNGCYHGHADSFLVRAGSGVATCGIAGSAGVPQCLAEKTLSVEFNDTSLVERSIAEVGADRFAAIIVEPVPGNMGLVLPKPGYLESLRKICDKHGILLIFDEVMTGFRLALGGAQEYFGIKADLVTFGKIIGGGLPVGAFGGRKEILSMLAPLGPVYQAGTLSGNPLAMAAGIAQLKILQRDKPYVKLEATGKRWCEGISAAAKNSGVPIQVSSCGSMIGCFLSAEPVWSFADAQQSDVKRFNAYFHEMLNNGVYLAPSAFEAGFLSTAHTPQVIQDTTVAAVKAFENCPSPLEKF